MKIRDSIVFVMKCIVLCLITPIAARLLHLLYSGLNSSPIASPPSSVFYVGICCVCIMCLSDSRVFLRCIIENRVPKIKGNYHRFLESEIGSIPGA